MVKQAIDTTDVTHATDAEGTMIWSDYTPDDQLSQVHINVQFYNGDDKLDKKRLSISDGLLGQAINKAYDIELAGTIEDLQDENPELSDEDAKDQAAVALTKPNVDTVWNALKNIVWNGGSALAEKRVTADSVIQTLLDKKAGVTSWGIRMLLHLWSGAWTEKRL